MEGGCEEDLEILDKLAEKDNEENKPPGSVPVEKQPPASPKSAPKGKKVDPFTDILFRHLEG